MEDDSGDDTMERRLVKVYTRFTQPDHGDDGWDDGGVGHVNLEFLPASKPEDEPDVKLEVRDSENGSMLLETRVQQWDSPRRENDTLIVWTEPSGSQLAVSFQRGEECAVVWEELARVLPALEDAPVIGPQPADEELDETRMQSIESQERDMPPVNPLPAPEISQFPALAAALEQTAHERQELMNKPFQQVDPAAKDAAMYVCEQRACQIVQEGFVPKLVKAFQLCEDLEDLDSLHELYRIFLSVFLLCQTTLLDVLFEEEHIDCVLGILEYNPEEGWVKHREIVQRIPFRQTLAELPGGDRTVGLIRRTFKMQYIRDAILGKVIDDMLQNSLNSLVLFNESEIIDAFKGEEALLKGLIESMVDSDLPIEQRRDRARLLVELCKVSSNLVNENVSQFAELLISLGVFGCLEQLLGSPDGSLRKAAVFVLRHFVDKDMRSLRLAMLEATEDVPVNPLLNALVQRIVADSECSIIVQARDLLRVVIDPMSLEVANNMESNEFLLRFYKYHISQLLVPFDSPPETYLSKRFGANHRRLEAVLSILSFCITQHSYRAKNYVVASVVLAKVVRFCSMKHPEVALGIVSLLRGIVRFKNDFYNRHIVKHDIFRPVMGMFAQNGFRYNLLNSAILDILEFVREQNIKDLVVYFVETFRDVLQRIDYVGTGKKLVLRYEQNLEVNGIPQGDETDGEATLPASLTSEPSVRFRQDRAEEEYFSSDDEDVPADKATAAPVADKPSRPPPVRKKSDDDDEGDVFLAMVQRSKKPRMSPSSP